MGSPSAKAYLASPYVVASSAISGKIDYDWKGDVTKISGSIKINEKPHYELSGNTWATFPDGSSRSLKGSGSIFETSLYYSWLKCKGEKRPKKQEGQPRQKAGLPLLKALPSNFLTQPANGPRLPQPPLSAL